MSVDVHSYAQKGSLLRCFEFQFSKSRRAQGDLGKDKLRAESRHRERPWPERSREAIYHEVNRRASVERNMEQLWNRLWRNKMEKRITGWN
jgi:hypothetical protein